MSRGFDALETGRLTWLGLSVAALGWALLVAVTAAADVGASRLAPSPALHADLVSVAQCLIGSGFALAVIGSLQAGFGALNRFFGAVLSRSSQRAAEPAAFDPDPVAGPAAGSTARTTRAPRPYRTLSDGSVEVDTILGTRRFASMSDARDFIDA